MVLIDTGSPSADEPKVDVEIMNARLAVPARSFPSRLQRIFTLFKGLVHHVGDRIPTLPFFFTYNTFTELAIGRQEAALSIQCMATEFPDKSPCVSFFEC